MFKIEEKRTKLIFYNSDRKYIKGHKFTQKKLFYIDCEEDQEENEQEE